MNAKVIHEVDPAFKAGGKMQMMPCATCAQVTLHTTPFFGFPFHCVANHGGKSHCAGCGFWTPEIAKVVVDGKGGRELFCSVCCGPEAKNACVRGKVS